VIEGLLEAGMLAFLLIILVLAILIIVTAAFSFWWMVPFVPTPMPIVRTMLTLADLKPGQVVYDLGAGDGRFLIEAKKREKSIKAIGYEGAFGVWLLAKMWIFLSPVRDIRMVCGNFMKADLAEADVIFTYLSPHVMKALLPKFQKELKPGAKIISHAFRLPGMEPVASAAVPMHFGSGMTKAYCYVLK
jgi:precorrin-6B methylase 2